MSLFRKSAGFRYLDAFILANVVELGTRHFCTRFLNADDSRVQANTLLLLISRTLNMMGGSSSTRPARPVRQAQGRVPGGWRR